jgi:hypothetical protein
MSRAGEHAARLFTATPNDDGATAAHDDELWTTPDPNSVIGAATLPTTATARNARRPEWLVASRPAPEARSASGAEAARQHCPE